MMRFNYYIIVFFLGIFFISKSAIAQDNTPEKKVETPDDDLGNVSDEYQEYFFEALKQRGIENYERAITALKKCIEINDSEHVLYFELAKNYIQLKNYTLAESALKKAIEKAPDNEWYLDELYGVYFELNEHDKALETVKQLVKFHPDYKEDLASLYMRSQSYKEALIILDELDNEFGVSESREAMRNEIYNATGADNDRIEYLKMRIAKQPNNESNYLNLIYRYSQQGDTKGAYKTANDLLKAIPESHLVHLALYKFYLDDELTSEAINSMKIVLKSPKIRPDAKTKALNDFVTFTRSNPEYEKDLLEVTTNVLDDNTGESNAELGQFYLQKGDQEEALKNLKLAYQKDSENFEVLKNLLLLQLDLNKPEDALTLSQNALEIYPAQPIFYLLNGVALNSLNRHKDAIAILEEGLDYIIDNITMEGDFYKQLSLAYRNTNNISKAETFAKKAEALQIKQ